MSSSHTNPELNHEDMDEASGDSGTSPPLVSSHNPDPDRFIANPALRRSAFAGFTNASERNRAAFQGPTGERLNTAPPSTPVLRPLDAALGLHPQDNQGRRNALTLLDTDLAHAFALNAARSAPTGPPRLSKADIRSIPERTVTTKDLDDEGEAQCNICIEPLNVGDLISCLYCGHFYHRECIETWFATNSSCPTCRKVYLPPSHSDRKDDGHVHRDNSMGGGNGAAAVV